MTAFDYRELDNRLTDAKAERDCLACGSNAVDWADRAVALIEVTDDGRIDIRPGLPSMARGIFCGARVCNACGFVHLYAPVAVSH